MSSVLQANITSPLQHQEPARGLADWHVVCRLRRLVPLHYQHPVVHPQDNASVFTRRPAVQPALWRHCSAGVELSALSASFFADEDGTLCMRRPCPALSFHSHLLPARCHLHRERHRHGHSSGVGVQPHPNPRSTCSAVIVLHKSLPQHADE